MLGLNEDFDPFLGKDKKDICFINIIYIWYIIYNYYLHIDNYITYNSYYKLYYL